MCPARLSSSNNSLEKKTKSAINVERWTKVQGSELDSYYVLSTWNPYVVILMKSRLHAE